MDMFILKRSVKIRFRINYHGETDDKDDYRIFPK